MTQSIIDIGDAPNDGTGDPVREAFNKCNNNFTELYAADAAGGGSTTTPVPPQGRLTLQTGTPVMTTTQSAKTTIYYTPYVGNQVPIYDGTNMVMTPFAELSVATTDTTKSPAAIGVSKINDWFVWNDAGTVRIGHGPDWTSDTVRSAGTALTMVNGIWLNNATITNGPAAQRGTYVGTTRSNASSQLDFIYGGTLVAGFFGIWNCYNRRLFSSSVIDTTASWTYGSSTYRSRNNHASAHIDVVLGLQEDSIDAANIGHGVTDGSGNLPINGIGLDAVTTLVGTQGSGNSGINLAGPLHSHWNGLLLGFHVLYAVEAANNTGGPLWFGFNSTAPARQYGSFNVAIFM